MAVRITLRFARGSGSSFDALAAVEDAAGQPSTGQIVVFSTDRGTLDSTQGVEEAGGRYRVTVTPEASGGEHKVIATAGGVSVESTAVVFGKVADHWDQPVAIEGLVNTAGWEDGIFATRDGAYLFVQYIPIAVNCKWTGLQDPELCETVRGPVAAPERPGFTGSARIEAGKVINTCFGIPPGSLPFYIPPCDYFGFRRQPDGSYAEPFKIGFEGSAGCLCPVGLNAYPNAAGTSAMILFSYNDPATYGATEDGTFFVTATIPLGADVNLGTWSGDLATGSVLDPMFAILPVPTTDAEMLGVNPFGVLDPAGGLTEIWFDNEAVLSRNGIWLTGRDAAGTWSVPSLLPPPVSIAGPDERMPYYSGDRLTIRRDNTIASLHRAGNVWSADYVVDLDPMVTAPLTPGQLVVVGEPSVAIDPDTGRERLYFNYGIYQADGTTNLNVGSVLARP